MSPVALASASSFFWPAAVDTASVILSVIGVASGVPPLGTSPVAGQHALQIAFVTNLAKSPNVSSIAFCNASSSLMYLALASSTAFLYSSIFESFALTSAAMSIILELM